MFSVFTKPWKEMPVDELAELVKSFGFDAVEFPLRDGYQAEPKDAEVSLPRLAKQFAAHGIAVASVASSTDEHIFAACHEAGVPVIRIMLARGEGRYLECEAAWKKQLEALCPLCEKYGVKVGVQQHYGPAAFNSMELRHALEGLDSRYIGAIWDAAHSALSGETPDKALDILWDYLVMVNFKNAYYRRTNGPEADQAVFRPYFTTAPNGNNDWSAAVKYLKARSYAGTVCMPAEYTDLPNTIPYLRRDAAYLKSLLA